MTRYQSGLLVLSLALVGGGLQARQPEAPAAAVPQHPAEAGQESASLVSVLGYGSFSAAEGMPGITATTFRAQMMYLKEQGITPVTLQQFIDWHRGGAELPQRAVLLTLDEADITAYSVAFPVLQEFGFPFVVFADGRNFQDNASYLDRRKLQEMRRSGASVGSRSMSRPLACDWQLAAERGPEASFKLAERELGVSAQRITSIFGSCDAFSYPRGYANENMVENLAVYGYRVAFSRQAGKVQKSTPAYMLNRNMVQDMPSFARAVNFTGSENDVQVLQKVRDVAASGMPVSQPQIVESSQHAAASFPSFIENAAAGDAVQPQLPPTLDPVLEQPAPALADKPVPEEEEQPVPGLKDPVLEPRPVSDQPAAGTLVKRTVGGDWVTREFPRPVVPREQTRVAVLGYHDFSNTRPVSEMCLRTAEFCQQMQYIKDAGLTVITMQDFQEWLLGDRCLPERCVLITIDDGWRSVYTEAFPVLKAYGYPFTLYLYTDFISGRGLSMSQEMIREMMAGGASIGSHSVSHPYPSEWKALAPDSQEHAAFLQKELVQSVASLKAKFGNCSTFCYPGGFHTPQMLETLTAHGVSLAFTVLEKKVTTLENPLLVHRYMVFGTDPRIFRRAVNFDDVAGVKTTAQGITEARARAQEFFPSAFENLGDTELEPSLEPSSAAQLPPLPGRKLQPEPAKPVLEDIPAPVYSSPEAGK